ncbi:hypothetical protein KAU11_05930, partial [Candidatus Babeliales bacterium]|nr:hypothetical protein [Candidatus Babeliales bacterium]
NVVGGLLALLVLIFNKEIREFVGVRRGFRDSIREYARVAFDVGIYSGSVYLATFFFAGIMSWISIQTVAAHQVANQVFFISYLPPVGFMLTASILIGHLIGEGRADLIKSATYKIMALCISSVTVISIFTFLFARPLAGLFSPMDLTVVNMATKAIKFVAINQVCCAVYLVLRGALTGAGETSYVMYMGLVSGYAVFLPAAYMLSIFFGYGLMGGYVALWIWTLTSCSLFGYRFITKTIKLQQENPAQKSIF